MRVIIIIACTLLLALIVLLVVFLKPRLDDKLNQTQAQPQVQTPSQSQSTLANINDDLQKRDTKPIINDFSVLDKWKSYTRPIQYTDPELYKQYLPILTLSDDAEEILTRPDIYPGTQTWNEKFSKTDKIKMYRYNGLYYILNESKGTAYTRNINSNQITGIYKIT